MNELLTEIKKCTYCADNLPLGPNPVVSISSYSKIMIVGQAPGIKVHTTGIPWDDKSGQNLRDWLGVDKNDFYDNTKFGIMPMAFCYPGKSKTGDLPPRKECAPLWHSQILNAIKPVQLTLLIGKYAQDYYLKEYKKLNLTQRVQNFNDYLPKYFVLPHPSPRNNIWMKKNEWFKKDIIPILKLTVDQILKND